jgi:hypothetical protein
MKMPISLLFGASLILGAAVGSGVSFIHEGESGPARYESASAVPTPPGASIRIVSPLDNGIVPIGQNKIEIATGNISLDTAHPWRLYLDGSLIATVDKGETTYSLPIGVSGPHVISATLLDAESHDLASASVHVTAAPESPSSSPFNLPWVAPTMAVFLIGVAALLVISLRVTRGKNQT